MTDQTKYSLQNFIVVLLNIRYAGSVFFEIATMPLTLVIIGLSLFIINFRRIELWWGVAILIFTCLIFLSESRVIDAWGIILAMYCLKDYPLDKFAKMNLFLGCLTVLSAFILLKLGLIEERVLGKSFDATYEARDLGFGNPNSLGKFIFFLIANIYILNWRQTAKMFFVCLVISYITFRYSGSRTYFLAGIVMALLIISRKIYWRRYWGKIWIIFLVGILFAFFRMVKIEDPILNILLSNRLAYSNWVLSSFSVKNYLTGYILMDNEIIDNAYISMLCIGGILYMALFIYMFIIAFIRNYNFERVYVPVTIAIILSGFMESGFVAFGSANVLLIWLILIKGLDGESINNNSCLQCGTLSRRLP